MGAGVSRVAHHFDAEDALRVSTSRSGMHLGHRAGEPPMDRIEIRKDSLGGHGVAPYYYLAGEADVCVTP